jgi:hypothetical protein
MLVYIQATSDGGVWCVSHPSHFTSEARASSINRDIVTKFKFSGVEIGNGLNVVANGTRPYT